MVCQCLCACISQGLVHPIFVFVFDMHDLLPTIHIVVAVNVAALFTAAQVLFVSAALWYHC